MAKLYPRLDSFEYEEKIAEVESIIKKGQYQYIVKDSDLEWLPVGDRIEISELKQLRQKILNFVEEKKLTVKTIGYAKTNFDRELGLKLLEWMPEMTPSIAADVGMWAYLNIVLIPDVIITRWTDSAGNVDHARFYEPGRNYLGILWLSAYLCQDPELYKLINSDWFITWFERSTTRGFPNYINYLYKYFNPYFEDLKKQDLLNVKDGARDIFRPIMKIFKRKLGYINYLAISENDFEELVKDSVEEWKKSL